MKVLAILALLARVTLAQASHSVALTWQDAANPTGTTYSVYRATGLCSGSPTWNKIATAVAVKTYTDSTVTPGPYCFAVTANFQGVESPQSASALANVPTFAPTALSVVVQ